MGSICAFIFVLQPNLGGCQLFIWLHKSPQIDSTGGSRALQSRLEADFSVCPGLDDVGEYMI